MLPSPTECNRSTIVFEHFIIDTGSETGSKFGGSLSEVKTSLRLMFMVKICASVKTKIRMDSIFYNAIVVLFCIFFLAVHSIFLNYRYVISLFIHVLTVVENTDFVLQMVNMLQCDKTNDTLSFLSDFNSRHVPCDHSISRYC